MIPLSVSAITAAVFFLVIRLLYRTWHSNRELAHIPTHTFEDGDNSRARYLTDLKTLLETGYRKYSTHGRPFKVAIPIGGYSVKYRIILPKDHLEEIKHLSNNVFSWQLASRIIFAQDYTGAPDRGAWSGKALRVGIHQNLGEITKDTDSALSDIFKARLPSESGSTTSIAMMEFFVAIIGHVTNARLVDQRLASDPRWLQESCNFAINRYGAADDVRKWPPLVSKLVAPFIPSVRRLRESRAYVKEMMRPLYEDLKAKGDIKRDSQKRTSTGSYGYEWLWSGAPNDVSLEDFSDTMMRTLIASIHTTAKTVTVALIDLLTQPESLRELREEATAAVGPDGREVDLDKLYKLDCFLKESQRLTPVFLRKFSPKAGMLMALLTVLTVTMNRVLTQDYTFKCASTSLPKSSMTSGPSSAIATDPTIFAEANKFDGDRYRRLREDHKGSESSLVMGMSTIDSLGFGLGNQACPGRFFAVNNMKLIMAKLLTQWELSLEKGGVQYRGPRPEMRYNDFSVVAPTEFTLRLKKL